MSKVTVTITFTFTFTFTFTDLNLGDLRFKFATAPVNVEGYCAFTFTDPQGGDLRFKFATAPVNVEEYNVAVGVNIDINDNITTITAVMNSTDNLSRFFRLIPEVITNPSPTTTATVVCTIDVVARGCGG